MLDCKNWRSWFVNQSLLYSRSSSLFFEVRIYFSLGAKNDTKEEGLIASLVSLFLTIKISRSTTPTMISTLIYVLDLRSFAVRTSQNNRTTDSIRLMSVRKPRNRVSRGLTPDSNLRQHHVLERGTTSSPLEKA